MPQVVKDSAIGKRNPRKSIKWETMTDGRTYCLVDGVDFVCNLKSVRTLAHKYANANRLVARTARDKSNLIVRFEKPATTKKQSKA